MSGITQGSSATSKPGGAATAATAAPDKLQVVATGFATGTMGSTSAIAVLHNPSTTDAAGAITVQFTAYGANTHVLGTASTSSIGVIRTGQTMNAATEVYSLPSGAIIDHVVAQVAATFATDPHPSAQITTTGTTFVPNAETPQVTASLISHYTSDLKQVFDAAVCFDAAGKVIGGGSTYTDLLPGGGTAGAAIYVDLPAGMTPDHCTVTAAASPLSGG